MPTNAAKKRRRTGCLSRLFVFLISLACALALGAVFYATMVYQLSGAEDAPSEAALPGAMLALSEGELVGEREERARFGGADCVVRVREYALPGGLSALALAATPAAYLERLSEEGWAPQLITGFLLAGLDAVYETRGDAGMLVARGGDAIYAIEGVLSEEALYTLGAGARIEAPTE